MVVEGFWGKSFMVGSRVRWGEEYCGVVNRLGELWLGLGRLVEDRVFVGEVCLVGFGVW